MVQFALRIEQTLPSTSGDLLEFVESAQLWWYGCAGEEGGPACQADVSDVDVAVGVGCDAVW